MQDLFAGRQRVLQVLAILMGIILILKCFQLQVWDTSYQQQHSYRQAVTLYPSRGLIYDRNNKLLINNLAMYDLLATYENVRRAGIDTTRFCNFLNITETQFKNFIEKDWRDKRFSKRKPFEFLTKVAADSFATFEEHLYEFPGFESVRKNVRGYPVNVGAHMLGYISEVNQKKIDKSNGLYQRGDYVGASGLELFYEEQLRGERGVKNVLKDKWGKIKGQYKNGAEDLAAISGYDLISSIDLELQQYAEQLMQNKRGAIVAIEPSTGEILAMVSAPSYNPQTLAVDLNRKDAFIKLQTDSSQPLFNRALMAQYPPGSIFKPVLTAIALQEGVLTVDRGMGCPGGFLMGNRRIGCHGHGPIGGPAAAIQYSCNNYFCQTYKELVNLYGYNFPEKGMARLMTHLQHFGLGKKIGVDMPGEVAGNIPTIEYFDKRYGKNRWRFSHSVSIGIGQGELQITPLQMANLAAIIANRGYYYTPHFAKVLKGDTSNILAPYQKKKYTKVHPKHFETVVDGMRKVILAGTGRRAHIEDIEVCGKTGTVENVHGKDHSTFIAFAPKNNPKIAVAVYVENGGYGSTYAAPISSLVIEKYIKRKIEGNARIYLEQRMLAADLVHSKIP